MDRLSASLRRSQLEIARLERELERPIFLHPSEWKLFEQSGCSMIGFRLLEPIPKSE